MVNPSDIRRRVADLEKKIEIVARVMRRLTARTFGKKANSISRMLTTDECDEFRDQMQNHGISESKRKGSSVNDQHPIKSTN
jgi:hypothetical protein